MSTRRSRRDKTLNDPWLEQFLDSPEKRAKFHIFTTIAYIVFILLMITGIMAVILFSFGFIG